jgi:hypothetical protein
LPRPVVHPTDATRARPAPCELRPDRGRAGLRPAALHFEYGNRR